MDSLTQIALGAAVGEASLGRRFGRRALVWGAALGTLPDLDNFLPLGGPVETFTYHRSFSHSLIVMALATPLVVWLITRIHRDLREHRRAWMLMVYLVFATHALLDSFTVYGTQIFWPVWDHPMTWSTLFIIDPAYTLPLIVGVLGALIVGRRGDLRRALRWNAVGLALSTLYLAWSVAAKVHVDAVTRDTLARMGIPEARSISTSAPFQSLLWRVVVVDGEHYYEGFYSVLDGPDAGGSRSVRFQRFDRRPGLLDDIRNHWPVRRLHWFTKGFYDVGLNEADEVVITDLRMGVEPQYVFRFAVGVSDGAGVRPISARRSPVERDLSRLGWLWRRIRSPEAGPPGPTG